MRPFEGLTHPGLQFGAEAYACLAEIVFRPDYPGYANARGVVEAPNGDGKLDVEKHYSHVSLKNVAAYSGSFGDREALHMALFFAHSVAEACAEALAVPAALRPDIRYGALRVLRYPVGATSALHTDLDLLTCHMYENFVGGFRCYQPEPLMPNLRAARTINPGIHIGEIGERAGISPATPHEVRPVTSERHAIVYFAIPNHDARMPGFAATEHMTVGAWLAERYARSRGSAK